MASFLIAFKALLLLSAARWSSVLGAPVSSENDQPETDREQYTTGPSDDGLDIDKDLLDRDAKGGFGDRWKQTRSFLEDHDLLQAPCLTGLGCPQSQCCIRQVHTDVDTKQVTFAYQGHCGDVTTLTDPKLLELNPIHGALDTAGDPLMLLTGEARSQDLLLICRWKALSDAANENGNMRRKRRESGIPTIQPNKILDAVLAPDVAFARLIADGNGQATTEPPTIASGLPAHDWLSSFTDDTALDVLDEEDPHLLAEETPTRVTLKPMKDPVVELKIDDDNHLHRANLHELMQQAVSIRDKLRTILDEMKLIET